MRKAATAIILLAVFLLAGCKLPAAIQTPLPTKAVATSAQPTPAATATPVPSTTPMPSPSATVAEPYKNLVIYSQEKGGFSIAHPQDWETSNNKDVLLEFTGPIHDSPTNAQGKIQVNRISEYYKDFSFYDVAASNMLKKQGYTVDFVTGNDMPTLDKTPAYMVMADVTNDKGEKLSANILFVPHKNKTVTVTCWCPTEDMNRVEQTYWAIMLTFHIY